VNEKQNENFKNKKYLKTEAMKTRIFTTAALFLLTVGFTEGATKQSEKDSASVLAYVATEKNHVVSVSVPGTNHTMESKVVLLENWIAEREAWEQEDAGFETESNSAEMVNLMDWVSGREAWEQESDTYSTYLSGTVSLEEWIAGRENWEQEGSEQKNPGIAAVSDFLGKWIQEREEWEQK